MVCASVVAITVPLGMVTVNGVAGSVSARSAASQPATSLDDAGRPRFCWNTDCRYDVAPGLPARSARTTFSFG